MSDSEASNDDRASTPGVSPEAVARVGGAQQQSPHAATASARDGSLSRGQRAAAKTARNPIPVAVSAEPPQRKPAWIRVRAGLGPEVARVKRLLREQRLHTVCEEASCPNLSECFSGGTATFMIMGSLCTRRCPFCDVAHGRPDPLDPAEPAHLAAAVQRLALRYVVITSVDRDDLDD
ncbi:MAG: hypothetical protein KDK91_10575, partial [Gammaproteobacteria bacterium]|nr:hypothetical protein [Gammaproteobacteria bacterium]